MIPDNETNEYFSANLQITSIDLTHGSILHGKTYNVTKLPLVKCTNDRFLNMQNTTKNSKLQTSTGVPKKTLQLNFKEHFLQALYF